MVGCVVWVDFGVDLVGLVCGVMLVGIEDGVVGVYDWVVCC